MTGVRVCCARAAIGSGVATGNSLGVRALATRYHGALISLLLEKPFFAIAYQQKSIDLMRRLGQSAYGRTSRASMSKHYRSDFDYWKQTTRRLRVWSKEDCRPSAPCARSVLRGEIVVNTDVSVRIPAVALKPLIASLADPTVGVTSCRDVSVARTAGDAHRLSLARRSSGPPLVRPSRLRSGGQCGGTGWRDQGRAG